ncbi:MAG: hypothetical protein H6625_07525 [Bdellovibrionaceae bacterium]|nr:hypothetical protein [Pseudobdellovibrionaceae bacterium]
MRKNNNRKLPEVLKGQKASQTFLEFCAPVLDDLSDEDAQNLTFIDQALRVPWMIWNTVVLEEQKKNQTAWHKRINIMTRQLPFAKPLLDFWVKRKVESFNQYKYLMGEYKLIPLEGYTFSLKIESRSIN